MVKRNKQLIGIGALVAIAVIAGLLGSLLYLNKIDSTSPRSSKENLGLMSEARKKMDTSICDQIRGGTQSPDTHKEDRGIDVFANILPPMNEAEAKAQCKKGVQWAIEHQEN